MKHLHFRKLSLAVLLSVGVSLHAQPNTPPSSAGLPSMGGAGEMSLIQERKLGDSIAKQLWRDPDLLDDPLLQHYVDGIFGAIIATARAKGELDADMADKFAWKAFIGKDRTVNAFALPGGYFGVHAGMLKVTQTRDEFASVIAHELSHVTQRHISRSIAKDAQQQPLILAATILGLMAARSADAVAATAVGSQAASAQLQLNFSRDMEREADRVGFNVLSAAGFEPVGMRNMFERLQQANRLADSGSFPYLRSHPLTTERIAEAQARVQLETPEAGPRRNMADALERVADPSISAGMHRLMSARAKALADNNIDQLQALAAEGLPSHLERVDASQHASALYTSALAHHRLRNFGASLASLARVQALVGKDSAQLTVLAISVNEVLRDQAIALGAQGDWAGVLASAAPLATPQHLQRPALMAWAATQVSANLPTNGAAVMASERLQNWVGDHVGDSYAWRMLSKAFEAQGRSLRSVEALATAHRAEGDLNGALERLKAAQRMARNTAADHVDASIIDTKAREIQSALREQTANDRFNRQLAYRVNERAH